MFGGSEVVWWLNNLGWAWRRIDRKEGGGRTRKFQTAQETGSVTDGQ